MKYDKLTKNQEDLNLQELEKWLLETARNLHILQNFESKKTVAALLSNCLTTLDDWRCSSKESRNVSGLPCAYFVELSIGDIKTELSINQIERLIIIDQMRLLIEKAGRNPFCYMQFGEIIQRNGCIEFSKERSPIDKIRKGNINKLRSLLVQIYLDSFEKHLKN